MRVLLIEDDPDTAAYVVKGLEEEGHTIDHMSDGRDGMAQAMSDEYDVLIVDRMLPGIEGLAIVKTLRAAGRKVPILFLTALGGVDDRVDGLDAGGDDYLVKPFAFAEFLARLAAILRRPPIAPERTVLYFCDLEMRLLTREVYRSGRRIELQPLEFKILEFLLRSDGRVVTRTMLLEKVWGFHFDPQTSVVETHMSRLRAKVDRDFGTTLIRTLRGVGYCLRADA